MSRGTYSYIKSKWREDDFYSPTLWMSRIIGRAGLGRSHRDIFAVIYGYTMSEGGNGEFFGTWDYLAALTMVKRSTVHKILVELEQVGLILKEERPNQMTPSYRANLEWVEKAKEVARQLDMNDEIADKADGQRRLAESRHKSRERTPSI